MGIYPVTRGQFAEFVKDTGYKTEAEGKGGGRGFTEANHVFEENPAYSWWNPGFAQTDQHPVVNVTWNDAVKFCEWLSRKEAKIYELPTEAQWEYACRAGTTTRFWCGDAHESLKGNANVSDASYKAIYFPSYRSAGNYETWNDGYPFTSPVGTFAANPWGLYDMGGNVWQWCADGYAPYPEGSIKDPIGEENRNRRNLRGGSFDEPHSECRSAFRRAAEPGFINCNHGLRVVLHPAAPVP
jgi:formylglycine-generating enzyme required for sulfatase activity